MYLFGDNFDFSEKSRFPPICVRDPPTDRPLILVLAMQYVHPITILFCRRWISLESGVDRAVRRFRTQEETNFLAKREKNVGVFRHAAARVVHHSRRWTCRTAREEKIPRLGCSLVVRKVARRARLEKTCSLMHSCDDSIAKHWPKQPRELTDELLRRPTSGNLRRRHDGFADTTQSRARSQRC